MMDRELYKAKVIQALFFANVVVPEWARWFVIDGFIPGEDEWCDSSNFMFYRFIPKYYEKWQGWHVDVVDRGKAISYDIVVEDHQAKDFRDIMYIPGFSSVESLISIEELLND